MPMAQIQSASGATRRGRRLLSLRVKRMNSVHAAVVAGRGEPGHLAKRRREGAGLTEAQRQPDIGHRSCARFQQALAMFDAAAGVIAMRRHAEGLLERAAEVIGTQVSKL